VSGRRRSCASLLLVACVALPGTGCSFWAVRAPASGARGGGDCTSSVAAPVIDAVLAAGLAATGALAVSQQKPNCRTDSLCVDLSGVSHEAGVVLLGLAAVESAAVISGGVKAGQCLRAKTEIEKSWGSVRPAPSLDLRQAASIER